MRCKIPERDLNARLNKTIIRYNDHPYYVITAGDALDLYEVNDPTGNCVKSVSPKDELLDVSTPPMGYFNSEVNAQALYIVRLPLRMYKQGLCTQSIHIYTADGELPMRGVSIFEKGYKDACLGKFPRVEDAIAMLKTKKKMSVAINKDVALVKKDGIIEVLFRKDTVGYITDGTYVVNVPSDDLGWIVSVYLNGYGWEIN